MEVAGLLDLEELGPEVGLVAQLAAVALKLRAVWQMDAAVRRKRRLDSSAVDVDPTYRRQLTNTSAPDVASWSMSRQHQSRTTACA